MWDRLEQLEVKVLTRRAGRRSAASRPEPSVSPGTDLLPQIKHIVVLMMENHSYDNYLGMLEGRGEGFPLGPDGEPGVINPDQAGHPVRAYHLPTTMQRPHFPSQSWHATHQQWGGGTNDGFVTSTQAVLADLATAPDNTGAAAAADAAAGGDKMGMGYWTEEELPFYYGLARTFPLADHWFSSCLGPTFPNRRFLIAGTAHGLIDDAPYDLLDYPPGGTIFDLLTTHGISWVNYHPVAADTSPGKRYMAYQRRMAKRRVKALGRSVRGRTAAMQKDIQFTADVFPLGLGRYMEHVRSIDDFFADAERGTLPAFSIVDPDFTAYSEENPQDIRKGESFAAEVINRVMHGAGWPDTLLIWVYDEHGGYYDHVPPPAAVEPDDVLARSLVGRRTRLQALVQPFLHGSVRERENPDEGPRRYDRYGFRVPAVIVSPYARENYVCREVFDHTSVLKLVEEKWNLPPLTARDAEAISPLSALDLEGPPAFLKPPSLPESNLKWGTW